MEKGKFNIIFSSNNLYSYEFPVELGPIPMESKMIRFLTVCIMCLVIFWSTAEALFSDSNEVRIAILKDVPEFELSIRGSYKIYDGTRENLVENGRSLKKSKVQWTGHALKIGSKEFNVQKIRIVPSKDVTIYQDKIRRRYRGEMEITFKKDLRFLVVNMLNLEEYVRGVLYHEVTDKWPIEALKAQAVAVRTYAFYQTEKNKDQSFDVTSDIYSQVYGGAKC